MKRTWSVPAPFDREKDSYLKELFEMAYAAGVADATQNSTIAAEIHQALGLVYAGKPKTEEPKA